MDIQTDGHIYIYLKKQTRTLINIFKIFLNYRFGDLITFVMFFVLQTLMLIPENYVYQQIMKQVENKNKNNMVGNVQFLINLPWC